MRLSYWARVVDRVAEVLERALGRVGRTAQQVGEPKQGGEGERDVVEGQRAPVPVGLHRAARYSLTADSGTGAKDPDVVAIASSLIALLQKG
jgi:hypothetical protein